MVFVIARTSGTDKNSISFRLTLRNYLKTVTLSEAKGLADRNKRFFAALRMTNCVLR
jgi:hypothetical protein